MKRIGVATIVAFLPLLLLLLTSSGCDVPSAPSAEEQAQFIEAYDRIRLDSSTRDFRTGTPTFRGATEDDVIALLGSNFTVNSDTTSGTMGRMRTLTWQSGDKIITVHFHRGTATSKGKRGF